MKQFQFAKYCTPAQIYLVLALIGIVAGFMKNFRVITLITHSVFGVLFAWILNFLCRKGFTAISWILVLLPFVMAASQYTLALDAADKKEQELLEGFQEGADGDDDDDDVGEGEEFVEDGTTSMPGMMGGSASGIMGGSDLQGLMDAAGLSGDGDNE